MYLGKLQYRPSPESNRESGYMLIVVMFLVVGLTIVALSMAPAVAQQIKRDREQEMIHRGVQYARAVQKYYRKFHTYPPTIEALEDTNHMRFLRKKYKDPMTADGKWQIVRFGQVQMNATSRQGGGGLLGGGNGLPNVPGVTNMLTGQNSLGGTNTLGGNTLGGNNSLFGQNSQTNQPTGSTTNQGTSTTSGTPGTETTGGSDSSSSSSGSSFGQSSNQVFGGGAIIGVASMSKEESLRTVDDKNHYNDWKFIYDPTFDRGGLITGPYDPKKQMGQFTNQSQPGQQIGQPIGQQPTSIFNNNNNSGSSFGQPNRPQMPPDQNTAPQNPQ